VAVDEAIPEGAVADEAPATPEAYTSEAEVEQTA
jgi:hypothetical protein